MITVLQIAFVLALIVLIILFVFEIRVKEISFLPDAYKILLNDYVKFYQQLDDDQRKKFEDRVQDFLNAVRITGVNAEVEDMDRLFIAAAAIIPVYRYADWQYVNLHEVLVYPGTFNLDFDQAGWDRFVSGMVGTGAMQHMMIISKWQLRQGFINNADSHNTAIHEFAHLIDKMDGTMDGVPEIILERRFIPNWVGLMNSTIHQMRSDGSDIDMYGATNQAEFFAVISEYFFERPDLLGANHPELFDMLQKIYRSG
ncbi:MAG TPA: M90 family metallopeptidase [Chitinophagaceae bacterium]|nr:M90 family metallopeptidase [Chitinophagaceae bacterium]